MGAWATLGLLSSPEAGARHCGEIQSLALQGLLQPRNLEEGKLPVGVGAEGRNLAEGKGLDNRRIPPRAEEVWVKGHGGVARGAGVSALRSHTPATVSCQLTGETALQT